MLNKLRASFGRFSNFLGTFVTEEALAKHLDVHEAMSTFRELYERSQPPARALVAHGLRELSVRSSDPRLRAQITQLLNRMMNDPEAQVREEATFTLSKMTP